MYAVEFIKAHDRMCDSCNSCNECPLRNETCARVFGINADTIVPIVEQWAMEPKNYSIGAGGGGCKYAPCVICRSEFWMQEVDA